jgi:hypothetical protein
LVLLLIARRSFLARETIGAVAMLLMTGADTASLPQWAGVARIIA